MPDIDAFRDVFFDYARSHGVSAAQARFTGMCGEESAAALALEFNEKLTKVFETRPAAIRPAGREPWYPGPGPDDACWNSLRSYYRNDGRPEGQIENVDSASNVVIAHTDRPNQSEFKGRGLVVGYVQSGKTTNFTAVAAKAADLGYSLVIVLSGIHNSLRKQTQSRLSSELTDLNTEKWLPLTDEHADFQKPPFKAEAALQPNGSTGLMVVKKNPAVLRRIKKWLGTDSMREKLNHLNVLVIDDEADQASVGTKTINPLIREILALMPRNTFIGYTATPFANVFIDPSSSEDLYPRDFILNLPEPKGYFGPAMIFGLPDAENDSPEAFGQDMIRLIDTSHLANLRPSSKKAIETFSPVVEDELKAAVNWFFLATAARRARSQEQHSSMLVHTFINTRVHDLFRAPLENYRRELLSRIDAPDEAIIDELRLQWNNESARVPAENFGRTTLDFDNVFAHMPDVVRGTRIVLDNSQSKDRLDYGYDKPQYVIAVGANTLSRGLTLEGLISSIFVRTARAYDTLLQMGRWFGFRNGYEELPRIWVTAELEQEFRHLAQVEAEMRRDIDLYQEQNRTPMDVSVRILSHPSLAITAKMGAAETASIAFTGRTLTTRYFRAGDADWLRTNLEATRKLANAAVNHGKCLTTRNQLNGTVVYDDISAQHILQFLNTYQVHEEQPNMDPRLLQKFIRDSHATDSSYLSQWTVVFVGGSGITVHLDKVGPIRSSVRSAEENDPDRTRIHTLTNPTDFGLGLGLTRQELREKSGGNPSDPRMLTLRSTDHASAKKGILLVIPIDPVSEPKPVASGGAPRKMERYPFNASEGVPAIGIGLGFPEPESAGGFLTGRYKTESYVAVRLPGDEWDTEAEAIEAEEVAALLDNDSEDE